MHLSYIYCGAGLSLKDPPTAILAYEPLSNHGGKNISVLFLDGHVELLPHDRAVKLIDELQSGHNPPPE
jgi:prepilin-type processing-associated H-X9-DG protein